MNIAIDPEILEVIKASTAVATQTGSSAHLLKVGSKRRRTRAEIDEFRQQRERELVSQAEQAERIRELEQQLHKSKSKLQSAEKAESVMEQMLEAGVLKEEVDGSFTVKQN